MMRYRYNNEFAAPRIYDDIVWEPAHKQPLHVLSSYRIWQISQRHDLFFEKIKRLFYRIREFYSEARTFAFIPSGGFGSLFRRLI